jgi:hypothetical protein
VLLALTFEILEPALRQSKQCKVFVTEGSGERGVGVSALEWRSDGVVENREDEDEYDQKSEKDCRRSKANSAKSEQ